MVTRKQQATLSREKLIDAARELIIEKGYNNISIVDITRACNMSVGNFYHYFKSKEELITVLEREGYDQDVVILQNMKGQPIMQQLRFYMESYIDLMVNTYGHHFNRQWFIHYLNNPTPLDDPANKINILINEVSIALNNAIEAGELSEETPVYNFAREIAFAITGANGYYAMTDGEFDPFGWCQQYCNDFLPLLLNNWYK